MQRGKKNLPIWKGIKPLSDDYFNFKLVQTMIICRLQSSHCSILKIYLHGRKHSMKRENAGNQQFSRCHNIFNSCARHSFQRSTFYSIFWLISPSCSTTCFYQSPGGAIKSHSVTALVSDCLSLTSVINGYVTTSGGASQVR